MGRAGLAALAPGLVLVALGAFFAFTGRTLAMTEAGAMGAGYFPRVLAVLLMVLGAVVLWMERRPGAVDPVRQAPLPWRAMLLLTLALLWFALTVRGLGLGLALAGAVGLACLAGSAPRWRPSLLLTGGMVFFCWLVFIVLLRLPVSFFGSWLR